MTSAWQPGGLACPAELMRVIEDLVPDRLWERIASLMPPHKPRRHRYPGRRPIDDRAALAGIVFVLKTGIAWNQLPTAWSAARGSPAGTTTDSSPSSPARCFVVRPARVSWEAQRPTVEEA